MTRPNIEEIRARADAATPGPWEWRWKNSSLRSQADKGEYQYGSQVCALYEDVDGISEIRDEDSEFIAAARADVVSLCSRVEELEAALRQIRQLCGEEPWNATALQSDVNRVVRAALEGK